MNADALLAAVLAQPEDDAPRLVYADWLDDHGQHDRAEFIRLQVRAAQLPPGDEEGQALAEQANALYRRHALGWVKDVPAVLTSGVRFRRGFIEELDLSPAVLLKVSARFWSRHPILSLAVQWVDDRLGAVLALPQVTRLRRLLLAGTPAGGDFGPLASCPLLGALRELTVRTDCPTPATYAVASCPSLRGLVSLRLDDRRLDDAGLAALAASPNVRNLTRLQFENSAAFGPAGARAVAGAPGLSGLKELLLGAGAIGDEGVAALAGSPHLRGLQTLLLSGREIGAAGARALAGAGWVQLRSLSVHLSGLDAEAARALAQARWPLTHLNLWAGNIGDAGAAALAESPLLAGVTDLDLTVNGIGDAGARALARSPHLTRLRKLNLAGNPIGAAGARALLGSPSLAGLVALSLAIEPRLTAPVLEALRRRFGTGLYPR